VAEYTSDVRHVAGKSNLVADALSRPAAPAQAAVDFSELARQQATCQETAKLAAKGCLQVEKMPVGNVELLCDVSGGRIRLLVPREMRKTVFPAVHTLAHPGLQPRRGYCRPDLCGVAARLTWRSGAASAQAAPKASQ
jgi:hypothetical protein